MNTSDTDKKSDLSTFAMKTQAKCFNCWKIGHLFKDCWHAQKSSQKQQSYYGIYP